MKISYTKEQADKLRERVTKSINVDAFDADVTEEDLYLIKVYYLGMTDGYYMAKGET